MLCSSEGILLFGPPSSAFLFESYLWDFEIDTLTTVYQLSDQLASSVKAQGPIYKFGRSSLHIIYLNSFLSYACKYIKLSCPHSMVGNTTLFPSFFVFLKKKIIIKTLVYCFLLIIVCKNTLPSSQFVCPLFHFGMSQNIVLFLKIKIISLLMFLLYPYFIFKNI